MQWELLTAPEFAAAVEAHGVCVLPAGCLEKHSEHLPLGTDGLVAHGIACRAAAMEEAIVFPPYWLGQINEARIFPGTIAADPVLTVQLLLNLCDEIARNGLTKIIVYNTHGGSISLFNYLSDIMLHERRSYALYLPSLDAGMTQARRRQIQALTTPGKSGHAGETETSIMMELRPELVRREAIPDAPAEGLGRLSHLPPGRVTGWWYAAYPDHYCGDARLATPEKGKILTDATVESLARYIRAVKDDNVTIPLAQEFFDKAE